MLTICISYSIVLWSVRDKTNKSNQILYSIGGGKKKSNINKYV